jgi:hypothetical protein
MISQLHAQKQIYIPERGEWFNLEATTSFLLPQSIELKQRPGYSISFSLMNEHLFGVSHWSLGYGIGFGSYHYNNNLNVRTDSSTQEAVYSLLDEGSYDINRQSFQYLEVPIELRYRTTSNKKGRYIRIYPYVKLGARVRDFSTYSKGDYSVAHFSNKGSEWFRASGGLRFGYWIFNLYANYELTPLYKEEVNVENSSIELSKFRTLNVGLSVSL